MKSEDFFRLFFKEIMNFNEEHIDNHFRQFKKGHHKFPQVIEALKKEVINQEGIAIDDVKIMKSIDELKQNKQNSPKEFLKPLIWWLIKYIDLYVQEIRTQIRFTGLCFEQYIMAKEKGDIEQIFWHVHHFAVHAANIDKLLDKLLSPPESLTANFFRDSIIRLRSVITRLLIRNIMTMNVITIQKITMIVANILC